MNCKTQASHHRKRCLHMMSPCRDNIRENFVTNKEKKRKSLTYLYFDIEINIAGFQIKCPRIRYLDAKKLRKKILQYSIAINE